MLAGNVVALLAPLIFVPFFSFVMRTPKYDWLSMKQIRRGDDTDLANAADVDLELVPGESRQSEHEERIEQQKLLRAAKIARTLTIVLTLALLILWPMVRPSHSLSLAPNANTALHQPMYGSAYIFSKPFFTGWVSVGILWLFCSSFAVGLYPLWEGRHTSSRTIKSIFLDITGKRKPVVHGRATMAETAVAEEKLDEKKGGETPPVEEA